MALSEYNTDYKELAFDVLSTLTVENILGSGAFGTVFLVRNKVSKHLYALKFLRKGCNCPHFSRMSTLNEMKVLQKIGTHGVPFTTKLYAAFQTSKYAFFLMNYLPGGSLGQLVESHGPLTEARAKKISSQVLVALDKLHGIGVSHRDLKPDNILVDQDEVVAIADFGISDLENGSVHKVQTHEGAFHFWSPEVKKGISCTGVSVDLWSFGLMLYYLNSGKFPFSDPAKVKNSKGDASFSHIDVGLPSNVSEELNVLISSLLNEDLCSRLVDIDKIKQHPWYKDIIWDTTAPFSPSERNVQESLNELSLKLYCSKTPLDSSQLILKASTSDSSIKSQTHAADESEVDKKQNPTDSRSKQIKETASQQGHKKKIDDYWTQKIDSRDLGIEAIDFFSYSLADDVNALPSFNYISPDVKYFLDQRFCMVQS